MRPAGHPLDRANRTRHENDGQDFVSLLGRAMFAELSSYLGRHLGSYQSPNGSPLIALSDCGPSLEASFVVLLLIAVLCPLRLPLDCMHRGAFAKEGLSSSSVRLSSRSVPHTPEDSLWVRIQGLPHVHGLRRETLGSASSCPLFKVSFRCGRIRLMLQTANLLALLNRALSSGFSPGISP